TTQYQLTAAALKRRRVGIHRFKESHLGGKVLAAVRDVHRRDRHIGEVDRSDAVFVVELWMDKRRPLGSERFGDVKADAGVALAAVPVAPIALHFAESCRRFIGPRLDFLRGDYIGALALDPFLVLRLPSPDAVGVSCG